jgi:hypothetical protein
LCARTKKCDGGFLGRDKSFILKSQILEELC